MAKPRRSRATQHKRGKARGSAGTCTRPARADPHAQRICMAETNVWLRQSSLGRYLFCGSGQLLKLESSQVSSFGTLCLSSDSVRCPLSKSLVEIQIRRAVPPQIQLPSGALYFRHYEVGRTPRPWTCMALCPEWPEAARNGRRFSAGNAPRPICGNWEGVENAV